jgi:YVTN family beta-propeller protein
VKVRWIAAFWWVALCPASNGSDDRIRYSSPEELALSMDDRRLYVSCRDSNELVVIDTRTRRVTGRVKVGSQPRGLATDRESGLIYVANSWDDTVSEVDPHSLRVNRTLPAGREPTGLAVDARAHLLYVVNRISGDVSVIDLKTGRTGAGLPVGPGASYAALAPQGNRVFVTRVFPSVPRNRGIPQNEIVEIDAAARETRRYPMPGSGAAFHVTLSTRGDFGIAAILRPKNLIPTAHVEHGGMFANCLALFGAGLGRVVVLPLDEIENSLAQPFDVAIAPDLSKIFVSASGADEVAVLDGRKLRALANSPGSDRLANDLSASAHYVVSRVPVGHNPRGMALSSDGGRLYVANRLDDTVTCLDALSGAVLDTIVVGETVRLTPERRGEQYFYSARFSFARQFSCASCHLDAVTDGLSWDLEQDGFGVDIVATKSLEALADTAPYKWSGTTPDLETECGARSEQYFFRSQGFRGAELTDVVSFLKAIPTRPNRNRLPNGSLTPAQAHGKAIFERKTTKDGRIIITPLQCQTCHFGPASTSNQLADVGTRQKTDRSGKFDTPPLINVCYKTSYLHDGSARTLKELWTQFNPRDLHGVTSDLNSSELDDLVEYLKTL